MEEELDALDFIGKVVRHIPEKHFKMIRYYGVYAKNTKHKNKFFKMIDEKVAEFKRKMRNWQTRILLTFGVNPLSCPKCGEKMRFNDIVYYGISIRERLKKEILLSNEKKIESLMHTYGVLKGIIRDKMEPVFT